jgi:hypothetical protein
MTRHASLTRDRMDAAAIKAANPIEVEVARRIALKQDGREFKGLCPFHQERTPSFTVVPAEADVEGGGGFYHCFGCDAHGDVIDFVAAINNVDFRSACGILGGKQPPRSAYRPATSLVPAVDYYAGLEALPDSLRIFVPEPGHRITIYNPKRAHHIPPRPWWRMQPTAVYQYRDAANRLVGVVLRSEKTEGGKIFTPARWGRWPENREGWISWPFEEPRPLYHLHLIDGLPDPLVVVEGEKAADAVRELLGHPAVTWCGGANGVEHADWAPLAGRSLLLWPDADAEGEAAMQAAATRCLAVEAKPVVMLPWDRSKPKGWDAADALADGWSRGDALTWIDTSLNHREARL